ncbi:lysophospholipase [Spirochaetia bacterium 38H-sp]|uniref:Lysophospholipase n=1 Tax=Rarispira pelagica TaxID=3141764 RepID=A0ABU9UCB7_9SPIR
MESFLPYREVFLENDFSRKGGRIFLRVFSPHIAPQAVVIVSHGFGEHSGIYVEFAGYLAQHGFLVVCPDFPGHGISSGRRGVIDSLDSYLLCLDAARIWAESVSDGLSVFVVGHSMGGLIAACYALFRPEYVAAVALSAPALSLDGVPSWQRFLANSVMRLFPHFRMHVRLNLPDLSRDPVALARLLSDPLCHNYGSVSMLKAMEDGITRFRENAERYPVPVLLMQGEFDRIVPADVNMTLFDLFPSTDKELRVYDGAFHHLFIDLCREEVQADILSWLKSIAI